MRWIVFQENQDKRRALDGSVILIPRLEELGEVTADDLPSAQAAARARYSGPLLVRSRLSVQEDTHSWERHRHPWS